MRAHRSIFSQLLGLALVSMVPLVAFISWGIYQQFQNDRQDALNNLNGLREFAERQIQTYLDSTHHRMERLAERITRLQATHGDVEQMLREFAALYPEFTNAALIDPKGLVLAAVTMRPANPADSVASVEPFRLAMNAKDFYVARAFKGPVTGKWVGLVAHPVLGSGGDRTGTLLLPINLIELSRVLTYYPGEGRTLLAVIDDQGVILMRSDQPEEYIGKTVPQNEALQRSAREAGSGSGELPGFDGRLRTYSTSTLAGTPWIATVSMPSEDVYRDAWRNLWRALGLVAIVLGLVVILLLRRAASLAQPLTALAATARAQAAGEIEAMAPVTGAAEIAETARAFNEMVTHLRDANQSLLESERRYRTVIDQTGQMIYDLDVPSGRVTWFGASAIAQITGYSTDEINRGGLQSWHERLHPDDRAAAAARLQHCLATGLPCHAEYRMRHQDGTYRLIEEQGVMLRNEQGAFGRMLGCMNDITARNQVEAALQRERALLRQIIDLVPHFIFAKDLEGKFVLANQPMAQAYGTTLENLIGKTDADFSSTQQEVQHFIHDDLEVMRSGKPKAVAEETFTDATGQRRFLSTIKIPFHFRGSELPAVLGVSVDITELKKADQARQQMERKLLETQKLESLGVLAGGIAHDFNNLLTGILGNASLARMDLPRSSPLLPIIEQIELASHRAADLCKQMLAYSGRGRFVVQRLSLNQLIEDTTHLLNISIGKNCVVRFNLGPSLPAVTVDATQIRQILMNLVINASEAIGPRNGAITISTGVARVDQNYLATLTHSSGITTGDYVFLEVSDNGSGMDAVTLGKIFDPFFTTKFTGRGLGLAAVLGIIRGHNGALRVLSEPGRGTTFRILLPYAEGVSDPSLSHPPVDTVWRGQGTVLVVDDEETVRTVSARILESLGFTTVVASDGREAIEKYRPDPSRYILVLLDLTMPHMDGEETFRRLREINPGVKVVLMSGFNQQEAISRFTGKGLAGFVQKPFEVGSIIAAVRHAFFEL